MKTPAICPVCSKPILDNHQCPASMPRSEDFDRAYTDARAYRDKDVRSIETDTLESELDDKSWETRIITLFRFARQLERQRDQAIAERDRLDHDYKALHNVIGLRREMFKQLEAERDALRQALEEVNRVCCANSGKEFPNEVSRSVHISCVVSRALATPPIKEGGE